jgi:Asp-tRNA(Asn)/Glu-tRNA(Gln) amidotransferase A subunit family amidase
MAKSRNSKSLPSNYPPVSLKDFENSDLSFLKIGIFQPFFNDASPEIVHHCNMALEKLKARGAQVVSINIPELLEAKQGHIIMIASEGCAGIDLDHYEALLPETKIFLNLASLFTTRDYLKASQQRTRSLRFITDIFKKVDCIVTPGAGITAPKIDLQAHICGESNLEITDELMKFMFLANFTGIPALTVPIGYSKESGLPISFQIMVPWWREDLLFRIGHAVEIEFPKKRPQVFFEFTKNASSG